MKTEKEIIKLDRRHSIQLEFSGYNLPVWVFRFCDDWVFCDESELKARARAIVWERNRKKK